MLFAPLASRRQRCFFRKRNGRVKNGGLLLPAAYERERRGWESPSLFICEQFVKKMRILLLFCQMQCIMYYEGIRLDAGYPCYGTVPGNYSEKEVV